MLDPGRYQTITIDVRDDGIAILTLDRPEVRNAVDDVMHGELSTIFAEAEADDRVRVVVLTGAGRAFSVGGDTSVDRAYVSRTGRTVMEEARHIVDDIIAMTKPLIAAVNGHAIGLGATLAALADAAYVEAGAKVADLHVRAAIPAGNGSGVIWPLLIGINNAKRLLLLGDTLTAEQAVEIGLLTAVVPAGCALDAAVATARRLAATAPQAIRGTKAAINGLLRAASDLVLPVGLALEEAAMHHPDFLATIAALSTDPKRSPAASD